MTSIEVLFCQKAKRLVRGLSVRTKNLSTGMVQVEGECPLHAGERLRKVRYPDPSPFSKVGSFDPETLLPDVTPPVNAGTVDHPSPLFIEVFWKTLAQRLSEEDRPKARGIAVVLWEKGLNSAERHALLDAFASTGKIPMQSIPEPQKRPEAPKKETVRSNPSEYSDMPKDKLRQLLDALNMEILKHQTILSDLLEHLEEDDLEAAEGIDFSLLTSARIIGDFDYAKLLAKRSLVMDALGN
jgi:hypothetical protein